MNINPPEKPGARGGSKKPGRKASFSGLVKKLVDGIEDMHALYYKPSEN